MSNVWLQGNPYAQQAGPYPTATPRPAFPPGYGQGMPRPGSPAGAPLTTGQGSLGKHVCKHRMCKHSMCHHNMCKHCMCYITLHAIVIHAVIVTCCYCNIIGTSDQSS